MLILSRKLNESIVIDGRIIVKVLRIEKESVKLGIQAPPEVPVHREEIHEAILKGKPHTAKTPATAPQPTEQPPEPTK